MGSKDNEVISKISNKPWKEKLAEFLNDPSRPNLRSLLQFEDVEDDDLEFKKELIDVSAIARHIIAMANTRGGAIVFGLDEVKPNVFDPIGIDKHVDSTDLEKKLSQYLPKELKEHFNLLPVIFQDSEYGKLVGKSFLVFIVEFTSKYVPFLSQKDGKEIKQNIVYVRRNRASEPANYDELQNLLNLRIETEYSSSSKRQLREHLEELKELFAQIPKTVGGGFLPKNGFLELKRAREMSLVDLQYIPSVPNPKYPDEDYDDFVIRLIATKKRVIENLIQS